MAALRTAALNLLRLAGFDSIMAGRQMVMYDITTLLTMVLQQPDSRTARHFESALSPAASAKAFFLRRSSCCKPLILRKAFLCRFFKSFWMIIVSSRWALASSDSGTLGHWSR
jgi:hypothetical protein